MKIKTQYDVGHVFYLPRVVTRYEKDIIQHSDADGNTVNYYRDVATLEPTIRHKIVTRIEITVTADRVDINYWAKNANEDSSLIDQNYQEDELDITDSKIAWEFARRWCREEKCVYFGRQEYDDPAHVS